MPGSYLERALDYIERHLAEAPTTEEVARAIGATTEQLRAAGFAHALAPAHCD